MKIKYGLLSVLLVGLTVMLSSMVGLGHADKTVELITLEKSTIRAIIRGESAEQPGMRWVLPVQLPSDQIFQGWFPGRASSQEQEAVAEIHHTGVRGGRKMSLCEMMECGFQAGDTVDHLGFSFLIVLILVFLGYAFFALFDRPRAIRRIRMES